MAKDGRRFSSQPVTRHCLSLVGKKGPFFGVERLSLLLHVGIDTFCGFESETSDDALSYFH